MHFCYPILKISLTLSFFKDKQIVNVPLFLNIYFSYYIPIHTNTTFPPATQSQQNSNKT